MNKILLIQLFLFVLFLNIASTLPELLNSVKNFLNNTVTKLSQKLLQHLQTDFTNLICKMFVFQDGWLDLGEHFIYRNKSNLC